MAKNKTDGGHIPRIVIGILALVLLLSSAGVGAGQETVSVSPTQGPPGSNVNVSGTGWNPGSTLDIFISPDFNNSLATVVTIADGSFNTTIVIPQNKAPGNYYIQARSTDHHQAEQAYFNVTPPTQTPAPTVYITANPPTHDINVSTNFTFTANPLGSWGNNISYSWSVTTEKCFTAAVILTGQNISEHLEVTCGNATISVIAEDENRNIANDTYLVIVHETITPPTTTPTFSISGYKINGTDNNGTGIPNWIIMHDTNGTQIASIYTMTDNTGFYIFSNLTNGTYTVNEVMEPNWTNISPISQKVTINGADKTKVNFTNQVIVTPTQTVTPASVPSYSSSGSSGSSGGSSGGGGVISTEPFNNIAKAESHEKDLLANKSVTYSFNPDEYSVYEVLVVGKQNEADVSMRIELLKGLSANVNASASDSTNVYKYINIKIGSERISETVLRFKVEAKWLSDNNLVGASMYRWVDGKWQVLDTTETSKDNTYIYYEAHSGGFSSFAIVGNKPISGVSVVSPTPIVSLPANQEPLTSTASPKPIRATSGFEVLFAIIALSVLYIIKRR